MSESGDVTQYLIAWRNGDDQALPKLMEKVDFELRRIAHRYMSNERSDHTLETGALVNEAYLRLIDQQHTDWQNRLHFFAVAARIMRNILVNHAIARQRAKRGGGDAKISLDEVGEVADKGEIDLLSLNDALEKLALFDARKGQIVELHFFAGLSNEECAEVLGVSLATINREWRLAKAWLYNYLKPSQTEI